MFPHECAHSAQDPPQAAVVSSEAVAITYGDSDGVRLGVAVGQQSLGVSIVMGESMEVS